MLRYHDRKRKSRALGSGLPQCLAHEEVLSFNVVSGCPLECNYCKYRSRRFTPDDSIFIYSRIPTQLREELDVLRRRGRLPAMVLFNTVSESFFGHPSVNKAAKQCLEALLGAGVFVNLTTKGIIPTDCFEVMAKNSQLVAVTISIASLSESFQRVFEPRVVPAVERIALVRQLAAIGVSVRGRIEPLMPMENDGESHVEELLREFSRAGAKEVVISYLQMDKDVLERVKKRIGGVQASMLLPWYRNQDGDLTMLIDPKYRAKKFQEFKKIGARLGIQVVVCACRNADMFTGRCFFVPQRVRRTETKTLF